MKKYIILVPQLLTMTFFGILLLAPMQRNSSVDLETLAIGAFFMTFGFLGVVGFFWKTKVGYLATLAFQYFTALLFLFAGIVRPGNYIANALISVIFLFTVYAVFLLNSKTFRKQYGHEKVGYGRNIVAATLSLVMVVSLGLLYHHKDVVIQEVVNVEFKEVGYGLYTSRLASTASLASSPSGKLSYSDGVNLVQRTDTIAAVLGAEFGVEYVIRSDTSGLIEVEQAWVFPESIVDVDGKKFSETRYKTHKQLNDTFFSFYSLDMDYEIVKGWWSFQLIYDGKRIYERKFFLE